MIVERTLKWLLSIMLIVFMYAYAMFQGGFVSWFLLYSVAPLILYAFIIGFFPLKTIKVKRVLSVERPFANQSLQVTLEIKKPYFPLFYLIVEDQLSTKLQHSLTDKASSKAIFFPLFKRNLTFTYDVASLPRGEHHFYRVLVKTGDLFGFIQKQAEIVHEEKLTVYPNIEKFDWKSLRFKASGSYMFSKMGHDDMSEVVGIRDYIPSDRLSWIDWKATAKQNQLVTKVFEKREVERKMLIFDDSKLSYQHRSLDLFEQVVSVTASLIAEMERKNSLYTLPFLIEIERNHSIPQGNWLEGLAKVEATREIPFSEYVKFIVDQFATKSSRLSIVTAHLSEELVLLLKKLASQHFKIDCFVIGARVSDVAPLQSQHIAVHLIPSRKGE